MRFVRLDAFFHMASQGSEEGMKSLYYFFSKRAKIKIRMAFKKYKYIRLNIDDFTELIDDVFFKSLNEYDETKGSFDAYADFLMDKRIVLKAINQVFSELDNEITLVDVNGAERDPGDLLADPDHLSILTDINVNDFLLKISSNNKGKDKEEKMKNKILLLRYAGYKNNEIAKYLKITYGQLRYYIKKLSEDESIEKLKLDLK